jgi:hypothetical protein
VGIAPFILDGVAGCHVGPFDVERWAGALRAHLDAEDPRIDGRDRAAWFAARPMARRVLEAYREVLDRHQDLA